MTEHNIGNRDYWILVLLHQRRQWHPTPVLLPGKSHGWRSLVGCGPWGRKESDMTERLHFHFSLSCIGEGNGNPLQCSCLENPRDGGAHNPRNGEAWWAAVYGVTQSQTRLELLSSSSSQYNDMIRSLILFWLVSCSSVDYSRKAHENNIVFTPRKFSHLSTSEKKPQRVHFKRWWFRMGNTCIPVADSFWYLAKLIQLCKV